MFKLVNPKQNFPELEERITKFWKENKIFEKSVQNRNIDNRYIFYDGPPFITGTPHYGSLLPSIAKDVVPRFHTMRGKRVERVWGWDCHGLPIENKVEKKLDIKNRREIEKFGIQRFIDECYSYTRDTSAEWKWYIDKIGRWVDMENAYRTMDQDYMETVMWVFKELHEKELIYKGVRTSLFCTRCGTPVSNFEIAMDNSYSDMNDPAVTIKFPVTTPGKFQGSSILAWTTTPWTLPSNKALVVDPEETYIQAKIQKLTIELEQAYLVNTLPEDLKKLKKSEITQAYIDDYIDEFGVEPRDARVRRIDDKYEFTVKYYAGKDSETGQLIEKTKNITKDEYIEKIKTSKTKIVKTRYYYPLEDGLTAEIDVYRNQYEGINIVEVEFSSLSKLKNFKKPSWFGNEVTDCDACWPKYIADRSSEELVSELQKYEQTPHHYEESVQTETVILAKKRAEYALKDIDFEIISEFKGKELLGMTYTPPFSYFPTEKGEHQVYNFTDMVHMEEGTGIVHSAPGFGDIDTEMGQKYGLSIAMSINDEGKFLPIIADYQGIFIKEADPIILENLRSRDLLFKSERIIHRYPYCWRCETPLIHKAQPSWFINVEKLKPNLLKNNDEINWIPSHLKKGRFKKGIEMAPDWGISRTRFWATPMPVWQREENGITVETKVIGSRDELRENAVQKITKLTFLNNNKEIKGNKSDDSSTSIKFLEAESLFNTNALLKKYSVDDLPSIPENDLKTELATTLETLKNFLLKLNKDYEGKEISINSDELTMKFVKHILEGQRLTSLLQSEVKPGQSFIFFLHNNQLLDLHRPKIDNITLKGKTGELSRVKEVLDVWLDSASMPYASKHYPFENKQVLEENYPADFIVEYIAQTRAWFYVMHVISTGLLNKPSFTNVITTGVISGTDGRKMSKSYGNYPDPREVLESYGAESLRLYLMGSKVMVGEDMNFDEEGLKEQYKTFLLPLWNCYSFFVTYATIHNWEPDSTNTKSQDPLDKWIQAQLDLSKKIFINEMEKYNIPLAVKVLPEFIDTLSRWYIRRSRDRFNSGSKEALETLYTVLVEFSKLSASIVPFVSEDIYQNLSHSFGKNSIESVHLTDLKDPSKIDLKNNELLLLDMNIVRNIATLGQSLRVSNNLKLRQPLSKVQIYTKVDLKIDDKNIKWMEEIIKDELNVKDVSFVSKAPSGKHWVTTNQIDGTLSVSLFTKLSLELEQEGLLRELSRKIQDQRKQRGLKMGDKINIILGTKDRLLIETVEAHREEFSKSVNATSVEFKQSTESIELNVNGINVQLTIS